MNLDLWGKETLRAADNIEHSWDRAAIDWPLLDESSVVWDVGAYKGRWSLQMARRYNPKLFCFEPQPWAFFTAQKVLAGFNAQVFNYALGTENGLFPMSEWETDGCTLREIPVSRNNGLAMVSDVAEVWDGDPIDLAMFNIEGYEYALLPYMFSRGILPQRIAVQFHGSRDEEADLRKKIERLYTPLWNYGSVLAAWVLKPSRKLGAADGLADYDIKTISLKK